MLRSLCIKNFALIEDIELHLKEGFSVITGETGAGKSILLGALSLLLGKRAELNSLKNDEEKCVIEGIFDLEGYDVAGFFQKNDLDYEAQTIIRREILPSGRSRAFINDTPVTLNQLTGLGSYLVDIHSQHETLFVGDTAYQYSVIDALAGNGALLTRYHQMLKEHKQLNRDLEALTRQQQEARNTHDYHVFLLQELNEAALQPGIQEELEEKQQELSNVEELKESLSFSLQKLQMEELGINDSLQEISMRLRKLENYGKNYQEISERINSIRLESTDLTQEIDRLAENIEDDPANLERINEKLQLLYNLQKKHNVPTVEELLAVQSELEQKVAFSISAAENTAELKAKINAVEAALHKTSEQLTHNRKKTAPRFTQTVQTILAKLGMPDAQLSIELSDTRKFNPYGTDEMTWLFSANKGSRLQNLKKSASGGELSRIALVVKSILATYSQLPTLIFDEIDTGISGEVAQKMGDIMKEMGDHLQVISITHLPQIAAKGTAHYKVYKETYEGQTRTIIAELTEDERIEELAEMLGGKSLSDSALAHAKSLLN